MTFSAKLKNNTFTVRENCDIEIEITPNLNLNAGDKIEIIPPNSWLLVYGPSYTRELQTQDSLAPHFIKLKSASENATFDISIIPRNQYYEQGVSRHGRRITAILKTGKVDAGEMLTFSYRNTFAPYITDQSEFYINIKVNKILSETKTIIATLPGPVVFSRIIVPSGARPGDEFPVRIVTFDRYENCSSSEFRNQTLYDNNGKVIADKLNFTGSIVVPAKIDCEGVFRFSMNDTVSNAVKISRDTPIPYWGNIHIHTKFSHDGQGENLYPYARDVAGLDFAAATDHWESLGDAGYNSLKYWAEDAYEPGKFATLPADERNPSHWPGHHNIYFRDMKCFMENKVHLSDDSKVVPEESWPKYDPERVMLIPHHTGIAFGNLPKNGVGAAIGLDSYDDEGLIPSVEIYSHHGQSELYNPQHALAYEFNRMRNPERRANTSVPGPYYAQNYWMQGRKFGVIASSDEHSGQGGRRHGGIAAVFADALSREGIFDAIRNRKSYATTGERILIEFNINNASLGEILEVPKNETVEISIKVWGSDILLRVEILRYRFGLDNAFLPILSATPQPESMDAEYSIEETITHNSIYYARVTQEPINWPAMAWTTPIWVNLATLSR